MKDLISKNWLIKVLILVGSIGLLVVLFFYLRDFKPWLLADYIQYWSASHLLLQGQNPYDASLMLALEKSLGWNKPYALMMYLPPWVTVLVLPLSLLDYDTSRTLWFFLQLSILVISLGVLWKLYAAEKRSGVLWVTGICIFSYASFFGLLYGQINFLILFGAACFLKFIVRQTFKPDILAGLFAGFIAIKPQVAYLFWLALLIWSLSSRMIKSFFSCPLFKSRQLCCKQTNIA